MPFAPANSGAMDAAAEGGPGRLVLPEIATGDVETIRAYAGGLAAEAVRFSSCLTYLEEAASRLRDAWSGGMAADTAQARLATSFTAFNNIINAAKSTAADLEHAADKLGVAQTGYNALVTSVNPVVAERMSNPSTRAAGIALAKSATARLSAFVKNIADILDVIAGTDIARVVRELAAVTAELDRLAPAGAPR